MKLNYETEGREVRLDIPAENIEFVLGGFYAVDDEETKDRNALQIFTKSGRIINVECFILTEDDKAAGCEHVDSVDWIMNNDPMKNDDAVYCVKDVFSIK